MREDTIRLALSRRLGDASNPVASADAIVAALRQLHEQLSTVVGTEAAAALVSHAVHRTRPQIDWRMPAASACNDLMFTGLRDDLAARSSTACLHAGETLIFALFDHLIALIGEPLTLRMLNAAWGAPDADPSPQENI